MKKIISTGFFVLIILFINAQCGINTSINQNFDTFQTGNSNWPQNCWKSLNSGWSTRVYIKDDSNESYSGNNHLYIYTFFSSNDVSYIVSPELSSIDGYHYASFYAKSSDAATIEYGTMSDNNDINTFVSSNNTVSLTTTYQQIVSPIISPISGHKYFAIKISSSNLHTANRIDDFEWTSVPCTVPQNIQVSSLSEDSAIITWNGSNAATAYNIEYGTSGFSLGTGIVANTIDTFITISNLQASTAYELYVQSDCGIDSSNQSTSLSFNTPNPYCQSTSNIQSYNHTNHSVVLSWQSVAYANTYTIEYGLSGFTLGAGTTTTTSDTSIQLSGLIAGNSYDVYIQTDCGTSLSSYSNVFSFGTIALPCTKAYNIRSIDSTENSATIVWQDSSLATNYHIEYGIDGFNLGTGTSIFISDTFVVLNNLNSNTTYNIYIKTNCNNDTSNYTSSFSFSTISEIVAPCVAIDTFFDDFESYIVDSINPSLPNCWSAINQQGVSSRLYTESTAAFSGNNMLLIYTLFQINDTSYLISPPLNTIDGMHYAQFYLKANVLGAYFEYGTMSDKNNIATYQSIAMPMAIDTLYKKITTQNIAAVANHKYFVIKTIAPAQHTAIRVDDFLWAKRDSSTSIQTQKAIESIKIYPNPSTGIIHFNPSKNDIESIQIYNQMGKCVATKTNNTSSINVNYLNNGIYFVKITDNKNYTTIKKITLYK